MFKYPNFSKNLKFCNALYKDMVEYITEYGYVINPKNAYISNEYTFNDISRLPVNEAEAYTALQNLNRTIYNVITLLTMRLDTLTYNVELIHITDKHKQMQLISECRKSISIAMKSIYASIAFTDIIKEDVELNNYTLNGINFYDLIDIKVKDYIASDPDCLEEYKSIYKKFKKKEWKIRDKIIDFLKLKFIQFKLSVSWLIADPELSFEQVANNVSPYPLDETRKVYGYMFDECVDKLNYAVERLNNPIILNLLTKYKSENLLDYFPEKFNSDKHDSKEYTAEELKEFSEECDKFITMICDDIVNLEKMANSTALLNKFIQQNVSMLIFNYKLYK